VSCEGEFILLREMKSAVGFYVHKFDYRRVIN
jgi:hypothetical protein